MLKKQPLTCLFLAATIAVDCVLIAVTTGESFSPIRLGMVLGQLAVLAIWAVRGQMHRLTRASCLVVATGLLTYLIKVERTPSAIWLAFYTIYVSVIMISAIAGNYLQSRWQSNQHDSASHRRWQIPLIEFFGWTTVVAIISFGARHMNFEFLRVEVITIVATLLVVPVLFAMFTRRDLRDLQSWQALLIVVAMIAAAVRASRAESSGEWAILVQTGYITIALTVFGMDEVLSRAKSLREDLHQGDDADTNELSQTKD